MGIFGWFLTFVAIGLIWYYATENQWSNGKKWIGIIAVLLFQQVQNISMTIGLLPIMGITLPFISYGGSSLISYIIMIGIVFNISNDNLKYKN